MTMRRLTRFFSGKETGGPDWWAAYRALPWTRIRRRTPVAELAFVVLDTETTGPDPRRHRPVSASAIRVEGGQMYIGQTLELVIHQQDYAGGDATPIHGIKPTDSRAGVSEAEALQQLLSFFGTAVLVGHHVGFDLRVLNEALARQQLGPLKNGVLDTAQLAVRAEHLFPNPYLRSEDYTLDALCRRYNVRPRYRHTASGDAFITGVLLLKLLAKLEARGVTTWGGLSA